MANGPTNARPNMVDAVKHAGDGDRPNENPQKPKNLASMS